MKHVPHVVIGAPWNDGDLQVSIVQWRHLTKVLGLGRGDRITYTDGLGVIGQGRLGGGQTLERGEEVEVRRPSELTVAVAAPGNKDRQRILVEKLAELGVARLQWLESSHGKGRVASGPKVFSWVLAAVEQSRGAWIMETSSTMVGWDGLEGPIVACDPTGAPETPDARTVVIGPEGGWAPGEIPQGLPKWSLGTTVLRTETAAIVAAARLLGR
jgi:16S rRNA U1498 N3-methylase RsmE